MSKCYDNLREDLILNRDEKEYRQAYGEESTDISVGTQIKVLREQRGWRQEDLANEAGIQQPMVSRYENVNYSNWTLSTLKKLARAFDVWLDIRFRSFGDMVTETNRFSREALQVPSFSEDSFFRVVAGRRHRKSRSKPIKIYSNIRFTEMPASNMGAGGAQMKLQFEFAESGAQKPIVEPVVFRKPNSFIDRLLTSEVAAGGGSRYAIR